MQLLTKELEKRFKEVGSQKKVKDAIVIAKFFNPIGRNIFIIEVAIVSVRELFDNLTYYMLQIQC